MTDAAKSGLVVLVLAGVALGAFVGLQVRGARAPALRHVDTADPEQADGEASAPLPDPPGHFLSTVHTGGPDIDAMTPTLLSPLHHEYVPATCPPRLVVLTPQDDDTYDEHVRPFFDAIGGVRLRTPKANRLTADLANRLERSWRDLRSALDRAVTTPPVRVLYKHYPRPDLEGRCVSLSATVSSVPDQYFDQHWLQAEIARHRRTGGGREMRVRGVMVEFRRTYQLEGGFPRLVEASVEVHDDVSAGTRRISFGLLLGEKAHALLRDLHRTTHFQIYGGGARRGLVWIDRSVGIGEVDAWARTYRISAGPPGEPPRLETEKVDGTVVKDLIALAQRP